MAGSAEHVKNAIRPGQRYLIHFREIVIRSSQPENRNGIDSRGSGFFRQLNRAERLIQRKHWAAEQAHLLPGYDCSGTVPQTLDIP